MLKFDRWWLHHFAVSNNAKGSLAKVNVFSLFVHSEKKHISFRIYFQYNNFKYYKLKIIFRFGDSKATTNFKTNFAEEESESITEHYSSVHRWKKHIDSLGLLPFVEIESFLSDILVERVYSY